MRKITGIFVLAAAPADYSTAAFAETLRYAIFIISGNLKPPKLSNK